LSEISRLRLKYNICCTTFAGTEESLAYSSSSHVPVFPHCMQCPCHLEHFWCSSKLPGRPAKERKDKANNNRFVLVSRPTINSDRNIKNEVTSLVQLSEPLRFEQAWDNHNMERVLAFDSCSSQFFKSNGCCGWSW
jgi:hypothetical protein